MKIALCISGQLRSVAKGFEYINRNLISVADVDVFLNFWNTDKEGLAETAVRIYKPKKWSSQNEFSDQYFQRFTRRGGLYWPPRNTYHSFYSVFHCNILKKEQEILQGFDYDFIVRTRFDYALNRQFPFNLLDKDKIYIPSDRMNPEHTVGSDAFSIGSSSVMDRYCSTYLYINDFYDRIGTMMINEDMLSSNLRLHGLCGEKLVYVDMNNPFPPNGYDSMSHSYLREDLHEWK